MSYKFLALLILQVLSFKLKSVSSYLLILGHQNAD